MRVLLFVPGAIREQRVDMREANGGRFKKILPVEEQQGSREEAKRFDRDGFPFR